MSIGRLLIVAGLLLLCAGVVPIGIERLNLPLGRFPGDIVWKGKRGSFYFPVVTCLLLSLAGSLILSIADRLR